MLFSVFTGSRPATLLADDSLSSNDSHSASADDLSEVVMPSWNERGLRTPFLALKLN
jgi:hypothetical protein